MPSPSAASPAELLLRCHLGYEIWMLQETYRRCPDDANNTARADDAVIRDNALIESFCVHARNLIEFFTKETSRKKLQKQYTNNYDPFSGVSITKINKHLNNQITHLREGERPITDSEKIGPQERAKILKILSHEIREFKAHLADAYKHIHIRELAPPVVSISFSNTPQTTTNAPPTAYSTEFYTP
jgi:hypothetical protein